MTRAALAAADANARSVAHCDHARNGARVFLIDIIDDRTLETSAAQPAPLWQRALNALGMLKPNRDMQEEPAR
jgi:hypothetical protein